MLKCRCSSNTYRPRAASCGFSLLEVMVALVVLCVGLLGILKLEAAAISSTTVASQRSLAALEAASLAASMHVNRGYWVTSGDPSGATIAVTGTTVTVPLNAPLLAGVVGGAQNCTSTTVPCQPLNMAAYDLQQWANAMNSLLPNYTVQINCGTAPPVSCIITIKWSENAVGINAQEAAAQAANPNAAFESPSYTLYVEP